VRTASNEETGKSSLRTSPELIERVSSGLLLKQLGLDTPAHEFLKVVDAWAKADLT
jgi:hypothetical protein